MLAFILAVIFWALITTAFGRMCYKAGHEDGRKYAQQKIASAQRYQRTIERESSALNESNLQPRG